MTVHVLDTPFQLPRPDLEQVFINRSQLTRQAESLSDIYLEIKREKLIDLINELGDVDKQVLHALTQLPDLLDNNGLQDLLVTLAALRRDADRRPTESPEPDSPEPHSLEADSRADQIIEEIQAQRAMVLAEVNGRAVALDDALVNLAAIVIDDVGHLLAPLDEEIERLKARIAVEAEPLQALLEQEAILNRLIDELEAISLADKLKPLVVSLERLARINPRHPLIGSIKAGIAGVANMLNLASEALKYEHLVSLRERLQQAFDDLQGSARDLRDRLEAETRKRSQLMQLQAMDAPRTAYSQEIGKLREALNRFLALNRQEASEDVETATSRFIEHARILGSYLSELRREWRSQG